MLANNEIAAIQSQVVGAYTQVEFTVKVNNPIPSGGGVKIDLPKWDPLSNRGTFLSFIDRARTCTAGKNV